MRITISDFELPWKQGLRILAALTTELAAVSFLGILNAITSLEIGWIVMYSAMCCLLLTVAINLESYSDHLPSVL